jgi:transcriptional regulator with XRE-family HTH domain
MERVPKDLKRQIGYRLRQLRKEKGMTMAEVANKTDIAKSTYAGFEAGNRAPSVYTLKKLTNVFYVTADYLLTGNSGEDLDLARLINRSDLHFSGVKLSLEERKKITEYIEFLLSRR